MGFPGSSVVKNLPDNVGDAVGNVDSVPGLGRLWSRNGKRPIFLPGIFHGQRSFSSIGLQRLNMTEHAHNVVYNMYILKFAFSCRLFSSKFLFVFDRYILC